MASFDQSLGQLRRFMNPPKPFSVLLVSLLGLGFLPGFTPTLCAQNVTYNDGATHQMTSSGTLATGNLQVTSGSTLDLNSTFQTVGGTVTVISSTVKSTGGGGSLSSAGGFTLDGGSVITAVLAGTGGLTLRNQTTLNELNTYEGVTLIQGSAWFNTLGNVGGGASSFGAPTTVTNGTIGLMGILNYTGGGTTSDRGINLTGTGSPATGGAIYGYGTGPLIVNGPVTATAAGAKTLTLAGYSEDNMLGGVISDGAATVALLKTGTGSWILAGASTYSGGTQVLDGLLQLSGSGTLGGTTGSLMTQGFGTVDLNGVSASVGTLASSNGVLTASGHSGQIVNNATGTTVTLTAGNGNASNTGYSGILADHTSGTGVLALGKVGAGLLLISVPSYQGPNTYSGGTTISGGTLLATGSQGLGTGPVTLGFGATLGIGASAIPSDLVNAIAVNGLLAGTGSTTGAVTLNSGGVIAPGGNYSVGTFTAGTGLATLTAGSITWNGGGKFAFNLSTDISANSDHLAITSSFNQGTGGALEFDFQSGGHAGITYTLLTFSSLTGFTAGDASAFSYSNLAPALTGNFTLTSTALYFTTAIPEPSTYAAIFGGVTLACAVWYRRRQKKNA